MSTLRNAAQQALKALESSRPIDQSSAVPHNKHIQAIFALLAALAEDAQMQPASRHQIVQVRPDKEVFGGCLVVVDEVKPWGIQGYVQPAGVQGQQWVRLAWEDIEPTGGRVVWAPG